MHNLGMESIFLFDFIRKKSVFQQTLNYNRSMIVRSHSNVTDCGGFSTVIDALMTAGQHANAW